MEQMDEIVQMKTFNRGLLSHLACEGFCVAADELLQSAVIGVQYMPLHRKDIRGLTAKLWQGLCVSVPSVL